MDNETEYTEQESLHQQLRTCSMLMMRLAHEAQRKHLKETMSEEFPGARDAWTDFRNHARVQGGRFKDAFDDSIAFGGQQVENLRNFRGGRGGHGPHGGSRGVAHAQARLLKFVQEHDGCSLTAIVEELDIRPSSASELVSKLELQSYVRRETNAEDKRVTNIFITDAGKEHYATYAAARAKRDEEFFDGLSLEDQKELSTLLEKLSASLKTKLSNQEE